MGKVPAAVAQTSPTHAARTAGDNSNPALRGPGEGETARGRRVSFSEEEFRFLSQARLARVATAASDGQPHVVPVAYEFDGTSFYFAGRGLERTLKFRNLRENKKVALVVDDLLTVCPWRPRGIEVRGEAQLCVEGGRAYVRVAPSLKRSWGFL
ncbi:MAG: PPOX class F420-dependent oxidoreductase [Nitrososphaerota archaeon]|nr:PPOX class F420-dependent oxidoreductase [Nitrososphaerota archaeon]MDG6967511.1 PPOX class F420-dependent oxidoreductase [Nitrososphaerota archaeon]MDG6978944.1 PPOX class F420-dependent oxidoreductase [Nitrososphaerota archaeon]MDG7021833.1 PPOX class F420-dependent oxidoreductase [Nitrososphaerota archaeon]